MKRLNPAIDRDLLEPIGEITVNFALLEQMLFMGIGQLLVGNDLREQRTAQIVTAGQPFSRAVDLFACLYQHRAPEVDQTKVKDLCARLRAVARMRNDIIHSFWGASEKPGHSTRIKVKAKAAGFDFTFKPTNRSELEAISIEIAQLAAELQAFCFEMAA